jgi:hypothetical protein
MGDEPQFRVVKELIEREYRAIPSMPNAPALPETRVFSRPFISYMAAFLPVVLFFRTSDMRVACICDNQYTATLEMLQETDDNKFRSYLTRKVIAWFRRWSIKRHGRAIGTSSSDTGGDDSSSDPGPAAVAAPKARVPAPTVSADEDSAELIIPDCQDGASGAGDI